MELPNLFGIAPEYLTGLLGDEGAKKLQQRATTTGLINMAVGYLAQPKNLNAGSPLPYLARSYIAGQQGAQGTVDNTVRSAFLQEQVTRQQKEQQMRDAEAQARQAQQQRMQGFIGQIEDPNQRMLAELNPQEYIKNKLTPQERKTAVVNGVLVDTQTGQPVYGTPELKANPMRERQVGRTKVQEELQADGTWKEIARGSMDAPQRAEPISYKTETDMEGNLVYIPNRPNSPVLDSMGRPTTYKAPAGGGKVSEGERKSATLLKRMEGSLSQLNSALAKDPSAATPEYLPSAVRAVPFLELEALPNTMTSAKRQQVEAAQLDILDAALTLGTGAAYTKEQMQGYRKSFFPQIGDDPATVQDKQARLDNVIEAAKIAAGNAIPQTSRTSTGATGAWSIKKKGK